MTHDPYDVAIIGAGHNGLTCAAYLAGAGLRVIVLEKNAVVGGAAVTEEFHPGFRNSVAAYAVSLLNPVVIADLELERHGLRIVERPVANFWPVDERRYLLMPYGLANRQRAVAAFSARDAERLPAYDAALERAAAFLRQLALKPPPNVGGGILELIGGAALGRRLIGLTLADKRLLLDLFTKSAADFLGTWFESEVVKGALAFDSIVGAYASPHTPGTAYVLLHHCFGEVNGKPGVWGHAVGGMGAISQAMADAAQTRGAAIRLQAPVASLTLRGRQGLGRPARLRRAHRRARRRRQYSAEAAVPRPRAGRCGRARAARSFRRPQVGLRHLPHECRAVRAAGFPLPARQGAPGPSRYRHRHRPHHRLPRPRLSRCAQLRLVERAGGRDPDPLHARRDAGPCGQARRQPVRAARGPAPPRRPQLGRRQETTFADLVIDTVSVHAPNFRNSVIARQVLSPLDLERRFGLVDGDIFHGQLSLDQLFSARPVLGHADYRMPVPGLYLCGSGAHPGGGVTGLPGRNAALGIVRDFRRRRWLGAR